MLELPHRRFALFRGPITAIDGWEAELGGGQMIAPPAFVWPADRPWCLAADVDHHWAGIGAEPAAIEALRSASGLDLVDADPTAPQPHY